MRQDLSRRAFVKNGTLALAASGAAAISASTLSADIGANPRLRIGLITDLHYADKLPAGSRHYRETTAKLTEAAAKFTEANTDFVIELGDLIDAAPSVETELGYLDTINRIFSNIPGEKHYVLGNHYVTQVAMVEGSGESNNAYSILELMSDGSLRVVGFRKQANRRLAKARHNQSANNQSTNNQTANGLNLGGVIPRVIIQEEDEDTVFAPR